MATYTAASRSLRSAVPRPITPSRAYLAGLSKGSSQAEDTSLKLVVLDLNGTLLFRHRGERGERLHEQPIQRPGLRAFCEYLFSHFAVMVWSSATPTNVQSMCARIFSHKQRDQLVNVWARDTLGLSEREYHTKCQTSKNLERVWQDTRVRQLKRFSQRDTILIDDSKLKALAQPYNLIEVPEFTLERAEKGTDDVLREVQAYLERLRTATNVSAYMKQRSLRFIDSPRKIKKSKNTVGKIKSLEKHSPKKRTAPSSTLNGCFPHKELKA